MARPSAMIRATMPSMRSVDLSLAGLRLPAGSWATATLAGRPPGRWRPFPRRPGGAADRNLNGRAGSREVVDVDEGAAPDWLPEGPDGALYLTTTILVSRPAIAIL